MADGDSSGGGSGFMGTVKSKWGPLPVWGWLALITVILLGYWLYEQHKASAAGTSTAGAATPSSVGQPGVVVINQDDADTDPDKPPPEPKPKPKPKPNPDPDPKPKPKPKPGDRPDWDKGDPGYDAYQAYLKSHRGHPPSKAWLRQHEG
jgi:hypothetical protein